MKQLFSSIACAVLTIAPAYAIDFSNPVVTPAEGQIDTLKEITIEFPNLAELDINSSDAIYLIHNNDEVGGCKAKVSSAAPNTLVFTSSEELTAPGEYVLIIGEGALCGFSDDYADMLDNPYEMYFTYNISGQGKSEGLNYDFTSSPACGVVTELSTITITFPNVFDLEFNSQKDITATKNGLKIDGVTMKIDSSERLVVSFPEVQTGHGEYVVTIGEGALCAFDKDYNWLDNPEPIVLNYTIEGEAETVDFTFIADPENGSTLSQLASVFIDFPNLSYIDNVLDIPEMAITVDNVELDPSAYELVASDCYCQTHISIKFLPALKSEENVNVRILFPAGSLHATDMEGVADATNANPIEINYTLAPAVAYDLTLSLNSPTKPNADGEISAEKQLDSFFFVANVAGLDVPAGEGDNVVITQDNGSFTASARLQKAYGFDSACSYFSAPFRSEPTQNGGYTIVISKGAFGNEAWLSNHDFGQSNDEITLHFTLIDGIETGVESIVGESSEAPVFNLQGIRMNGSLNELPEGLYIVNGKKVKK